MEPNQIADAAVWAGRQQAFAAIASKCTAAQAECLREVRETRAYEQLGLTWEGFCKQYAGISRVHADSLIRRREEFGEAYFRLAALVRVSPETFRQIADKVTEETIEIDGELVPLIPANAARIRKSIQHLRDEVKRVHHYFRVPGKTVEYGVRLDDILAAVTTRAKLARALPHDELAGLRALAHHAVAKWKEVAEMLKPFDAPSTFDTDSAR